MNTINDVAKRAGVSAMTVSRVLNNSVRVSAETKERVLQAVRELNYVPNQAARTLVQGTSRTLALLVTDVTNPFFTTIARGVEDTAQKSGYRVLLCNTDEDHEKERGYVEALVASRVDGVVAVPTDNSSRRNLELLTERGIPFVLVDRSVDGVASDLVVGDNEMGARVLTEHLVKQGYERIALVAGPLATSTAHERAAGYRRALLEAGQPHDPALEIEVSYKVEGGQKAAQLLLASSEPPTAVVCSNNLQAVGLVMGLRAAGKRIPEDMAVCCFEDVELASLLDPFLTVAVQPAYSFGSIATHLLLERLEGKVPPSPRRVLLQPELVYRRSTTGNSKAPSGRASK